MSPCPCSKRFLSSNRDCFSGLFRASQFSKYSPKVGQIINIRSDGHVDFPLKRPIPSLSPEASVNGTSVTTARRDYSHASRILAISLAPSCEKDQHLDNRTPLYEGNSILKVKTQYDNRTFYEFDGSYGELPYEDKTDELLRLKTLKAISLAIGIDHFSSGTAEGTNTDNGAEKNSRCSRSEILSMVKNRCDSDWNEIENMSKEEFLALVNGSASAGKDVQYFVTGPVGLSGQVTLPPSNPKSDPYGRAVGGGMRVSGRLLGPAPGGFAVSIGGWVAHLPKSSVSGELLPSFVDKYRMVPSDAYAAVFCRLDRSTGIPHITLAFDERNHVNADG